MTMVSRPVYGAALVLAALSLVSCDRKIEVVDTTLPETKAIDGDNTSPPIIASKDKVETEEVLPVDLSTTLTFSHPAECIANGTLEKVYKKLDAAMNNGSSNLTVKLDEFSKPFTVNVKNYVSSDGAANAAASIKLPENATWNGLKLSRVQTAYYAPPETDSAYNRNITFLEEPEKVVSMLNSLGFSAKLAPEYTELMETDENVCGGSMQVERISGGTIFSCGWGC